MDLYASSAYYGDPHQETEIYTKEGYDSLPDEERQGLVEISRTEFDRRAALVEIPDDSFIFPRNRQNHHINLKGCDQKNYDLAKATYYQPEPKP